MAKRDYLNFAIVIMELICYYRVCDSYKDFFDRGLLLTGKILNERFLLVKLKASLQKSYGRHHDFVNCYGISVS